MTVLCWTHAHCRIPPVIHPAFAMVYSQDGRVMTPLCQASLNNWLDNADDDDDLEPSHIRWLADAP